MKTKKITEYIFSWDEVEKALKIKGKITHIYSSVVYDEIRISILGDDKKW